MDDQRRSSVSGRLKAATVEYEERGLGFWRRNKSIALMILAQFISSLMAVSSKLLQTSSEECGALGTSQVLIMMLSITMMLCWLWMLAFDVYDAPFGATNLWPLLSIRGIAGVFGIWGFYYSLRFLPLAEATVINFLAPMVAALASTLLIGTPFTRVQQISGAISFIGVVLVSQPWKMFADVAPQLPKLVQSGQTQNNATTCTNCTELYVVSEGPSANSLVDGVTSLEHASAIAAAMVGVMGGAAAYVAMTSIGKRAHIVITVNYFAVWTVILSAVSLIFTGLEDFRLPNVREWALILFLGICGLGLQLLITASLQGENSNRALNMVYTQIVFALIMDRAVWGMSPNWISLIGGGLILGSAIAVALLKENVKRSKAQPDIPRIEVHDEEEIELMIGQDPDHGKDEMEP